MPPPKLLASSRPPGSSNHTTPSALLASSTPSVQVPVTGPTNVRRTKILATLGPSSSDPATIVKMQAAGLDAVRINFSHGSPAEHAAIHEAVREAERDSGKPLPIMQDLQGTKIRIGHLHDGQVRLEPGQTLRVDAEPGMGGPDRLPVDDDLVVKGAKAGGQLLLGDGDVILHIDAAHGDHLDVSVVNGGILRQGAGITAPGIPLPGGLTDKDKADIKQGADLGVELVALSFVRTGDDIREARTMLRELDTDPLLLAKVERIEALENLDDILDAADGILVARGDLGIALPPERVPVEQKSMLRRAAQHGAIAVTATQMLESMIKSPRPTRAEASDVANALLDGTHVVMLSGETAIGDHPLAVVDMMARIVRETERSVWSGELPTTIHRGQSEGHEAGAIALACAVTAEDLDAAAILACTRTGMTAMRVTKHRPRIPVIGATPDVNVWRRLNISWGVTPLLVQDQDNMRAFTNEAMRVAKDAGLVDKGDTVVVTGGDIGVPGSTNIMRVTKVA